MDIFTTIKNLNDNEIDNYIEYRLSKLNNKEEKEIGYNTDTTIFDGFLDENVRVNTYYEIIKTRYYAAIHFGSLVFNDPDMYKYLIEESKKYDNPLEAVISATDNYLSLNSVKRKNSNIEKIREKYYGLYSANNNRPLPIRLFHNYPISMCTEVAGVVHNMFNFLGIESDYVIGSLNGIDHTFNIVHYFGKGNDAILVDNCKEINSSPAIVVLDKEKQEKIYSFKPVFFVEDDIKNAYMNLLSVKIKSANQKLEYSIMEDASFELEGFKAIPCKNKRELLFRRSEKK